MAQSIANPNPVQVIGRASECMRRLMEAGLTFDDLQTPIDNPSMRRRIVRFWQGSALKNAEKETFPVTVDYDRPLSGMIVDGKYDWKNPEITEKNFPIEGKGKVKLKIELVHFNKCMESVEILKELDKQGLRPATLPELLAFGTKYPDKQREFRIAALGSVWRYWTGHRVPYLGSDGSERAFGIYWFEGRWHADYWFAAVRKSN